MIIRLMVSLLVSVWMNVIKYTIRICEYHAEVTLTWPQPAIKWMWQNIVDDITALSALRAELYNQKI